MKRIDALEILLTNIQIATQKMYFSQHKAAEIVGGRTKLNRLAEQGEIEVEFGKGVWKYNAWQVLKHCGNKRPKKPRHKKTT